jgi:hypothetical protein
LQSKRQVLLERRLIFTSHSPLCQCTSTLCPTSLLSVNVPPLCVPPLSSVNVPPLCVPPISFLSMYLHFVSHHSPLCQCTSTLCPTTLLTVNVPPLCVPPLSSLSMYLHFVSHHSPLCQCTSTLSPTTLFSLYLHTSLYLSGLHSYSFSQSLWCIFHIIPNMCNIISAFLRTICTSCNIQ